MLQLTAKALDGNGVRISAAPFDAGSEADIQAYRRSRVRADTLFSTGETTLIHKASRGYPRGINNLAVNALTAAFARDGPIVDEKAARIAITETD